jgi:hypothetical protein
MYFLNFKAVSSKSREHNADAFKSDANTCIVQSVNHYSLPTESSTTVPYPQKSGTGNLIYEAISFTHSN